MSFSDKVVLLTGASSGIGAETAVYLAKENAQLALVGRSAQKFENVVAKIRETGSEIEPLVILADITVDAERIVSETIDKFGRIDVLINNAGFAIPETLESFQAEHFDGMMATNVRAAIQLTQLAAPHLIEAKGNILNVSSAASLRPFVGYLSYSISKSAMDQFTKCVALELSPKGVRVNSVNPGFILTEFHANAGIPADQVESMLDAFAKLHPIGRIGTADDVVKAIAFITNNDLAPFITGVCMPVDGASSIHQ